MRPLEILREISERDVIGRNASFIQAQALKAIELIGHVDGLGRKRLSKELHLGEGVVRTLINRMRGLGLIEISRGGMKLTSEGRQLLAVFTQRLAAAELRSTPLTVGTKNYALLIKVSSMKISRGIEQRDAAIIAGAKGATTLLYENGELKMPGLEMKLDDAIIEEITQKLTPEDGDVIIIGSANDIYLAEIGAKAAALELLRE